MQPPLAGSQVNPGPHAELFGVWLQLPFTQLSVVQAIKSLQSASAQHALQPVPEQHLPPLAHVLNVQLPFTHFPVPALHGSSLVHCESFTHCAVCKHPFVTSHVNPVLHVVKSSVCEQVPVVHESFVQSTLSSQSDAEQHVPQEADVLSAFGQQVGAALPAAHSAECSHLPALHLSTVHGLPSLHCESSQHSAQPTPAQHSMPEPQSFGAYSHSMFVQAGTTHGSLLLQSPSTAHASFFLHPFATVQYSSAAQLLLSGACVHAPAKQSSSVQLTPSSQSCFAQHSPHCPSQHFSVASHFGARLHRPSALH